MINYFKINIFNFLIIFFLGIQVFIYFFNQKPLTKDFSKMAMSVENFSSIVLSKSGITKIGSEKLKKIDDKNIYLEGKSYLENKEYKIYGEDISIKLEEEISNSNKPVKVLNSMGVLNAQGFQNFDNEGIMTFKGKVEFFIDD
tara:strand:+ start:64 stop:492 length:429 start_codon:yes stop_codon:yes gene_type:complete